MVVPVILTKTKGNQNEMEKLYAHSETFYQNSILYESNVLHTILYGV